MCGTRTVFEQDKYKVCRASSYDTPVVSALENDIRLERVAISLRRRNDNPTQITRDLRAGGGLVLYRGSLPVSALSNVPARDGSSELRRLGVTRTFSGRGFTTLAASALEKLARVAEMSSIRIPVDAYAPQYNAYFEKISFTVKADRTFSTVLAAAMRPILMRKLFA